MKSIRSVFSFSPSAFRLTRQACTSAILIIALLLPLGLRAGDREGNGGTDIQATYIRLGNAIIAYLTLTDRGIALVRQHKLDIKKLKEALKPENVKVVDGILKDNDGTDCDARFEKGKTELHKSSWEKYFLEKKDVYYLVGHEMFRFAGVPDDGYKISDPAFFPFPDEYKVQLNLRPEYPLLPGELLRNVLLSDKLIFNGNGCPVNTPGTYVDFDYERNIINITMYEMGAVVGKYLPLQAERRLCMLNFPIVIPKNKRLLFTQMDVTTQLGIPNDSSLRLRTEIYIAGRRSKVYERYLAPKDYTFGKTMIRENDVLQSDCGEANHLVNIVTSLRVTGESWLPAVTNSTRQALYLKLVDCEK